MKRIKGGYYIKARQIQQSKISHGPPSIREIWDWLLMEANHTDTKYDGFIIKRGQLFRTYKEIREGLAWHVGWRKMMYSENHVKKAMKFLRRELMIASQKALGGVIITILNYDFYQNPKSYEGTKEGTNERTIEEPLKNQPIPDNNKNEKNEKNEKNKEEYAEFVKMTIEEFDKLVEEYGHESTIKMIERLDNYKGSSGKKYKNDYRAILSWVVDEIMKKSPKPKFAFLDKPEYADDS